MTGPSLFSIAVLLTVSLLPFGTNAFSAAPPALCLTKQLPTNGESRPKTALGIGNLFRGGEKKQETSSGGGTTVVDIHAKVRNLSPRANKIRHKYNCSLHKTDNQGWWASLLFEHLSSRTVQYTGTRILARTAKR
jgi:hypothetical protein